MVNISTNMTNLKKEMPPQDLHYYRPLHLWAMLAGILPNFDLNQLQASYPVYVYGIVILVFFCCIYVCNTYGKIIYLTPIYLTWTLLTDIGADAALFITNVTAIVRVSLAKAKSVHRFLAHLKQIDVELRSINQDVRYPRRVFLIEFICTNVAFVIYCFYNVSIWVKSVTWNTYRWYFLRDVQCLHLLILSLVMRNYSLAIRNRVHILNELLVQMRPPEDDHVYTSTGFIRMVHALHMGDDGSRQSAYDRIQKRRLQVQRMRMVYAQICITMSIYNDIFGWIYLALYVAIVIYFCNAFNVILVYGIGNTTLDNTDFGITLIMLCILWSANPLTVGFFIFSSANKLRFEIKRTPVICYSIIDGWLPLDEGHVLVPEVEKFAQQVANSHAKINAAGFFTVNYAIFFALIGSLSSYLIVLIQFVQAALQGNTHNIVATHVNRTIDKY